MLLTVVGVLQFNLLDKSSITQVDRCLPVPLSVKLLDKLKISRFIMSITLLIGFLVVLMEHAHIATIFTDETMLDFEIMAPACRARQTLPAMIARFLWDDFRGGVDHIRQLDENMRPLLSRVIEYLFHFAFNDTQLGKILLAAPGS
jgi:hypothetical protein